MSAMFTLLGEGEYRPEPLARGYWAGNSLQGRAVVGLLGHVLGSRHGGEGLVPARLTIDLHRLVPFQPVRIETEVLRDGARLRLVEARLVAGGIEQARATCQFLRPGAAPDKPRWSAGGWDAPHPETLEPLPPGKGLDIFEWRHICGRMGGTPPRRMWMREIHELVAGQPFTPWDRLVAGADFASAWAHGLPFDPGYMNTDATIQIHRLPVGEWIGYEATSHDASDGIAVGHCRIHDVEGPLGFVATTAVHHQRRP